MKKIAITRAETPKIILKTTGYRGRNIKLMLVSEKVTIDGTYWDGGSKTFWVMVNTMTNEVRSIPGTLAAPMNYGGMGTQMVDVPDEWLLVANDIFCGKNVGLRIFMKLPASLAVPAITA